MGVIRSRKKYISRHSKLFTYENIFVVVLVIDFVEVARFYNQERRNEEYKQNGSLNSAIVWSLEMLTLLV